MAAIIMTRHDKMKVVYAIDNKAVFLLAPIHIQQYFERPTLRGCQLTYDMMQG